MLTNWTTALNTLEIWIVQEVFFDFLEMLSATDRMFCHSALGMLIDSVDVVSSVDVFLCQTDR